MDDQTLENMEALVSKFRYYVTLHTALKTRASKDYYAERIDDLISQADSNAMSLDELEELAGVTW